MDFLIAILVLFGSLLFAIMGNMISNELYDCVPSCARWLIERAVARAPEKFRDRYREQWLADNADWQGGKLGKLCHAFGCYFAALSIARIYPDENLSIQKTIEVSGQNFEYMIIFREMGLRGWITIPYRSLFRVVWHSFIETGFVGIRIRYHKYNLKHITLRQIITKSTKAYDNNL